MLLANMFLQVLSFFRSVHPLRYSSSVISFLRSAFQVPFASQYLSCLSFYSCRALPALAACLFCLVDFVHDNAGAYVQTWLHFDRQQPRTSPLFDAGQFTGLFPFHTRRANASKLLRIISERLDTARVGR